SATGKAIVCPYHNWAYELSGELRGAPGFRDTPGFSTAAWPLRQMPAVEWHGLVFIDGSGGAAGPLPLAALGEIVAPYEPERLVTVAEHSYDAAANWKILTENYHECYHCPAIHPELCRVSPPRSGENYASSGSWIGGWVLLGGGAATLSLGERLLVAAAGGCGDDAAGRPRRGRATARPVRRGAADGRLHRGLPERAAQ